MRARRWLAGAALGIAGLAGCTAGPPTDSQTTRLWTDDYYIRVTSDPSPPRALEQVQYTVVVQDKKTRAPIDIGEGRIFATAGPWAMGVQFRRDSTQKLQRTNDWMQEVMAASEPSQDASKARPGQ